jgi:chaperonin GroES
MKIIPLHNNIVIEQTDNTEEMYGNILIPDMGKEKVMVGNIIAVGPGRYTETGAWVNTFLQIGQTVTFPTFGGQRLTIDGKEYLLYKEQDIFAILEK